MGGLDDLLLTVKQSNKALNTAALQAELADVRAALQTDMACQRQLENVGFRRKGMSFFAGQYTSVYSP